MTAKGMTAGRNTGETHSTNTDIDRTVAVRKRNDTERGTQIAERTEEPKGYQKQR